MIIRVEHCIGNKFRLCRRYNKDVEFILGDTWTRSLTSRALDLYEHVYGYCRRNIRFDVH